MSKVVGKFYVTEIAINSYSNDGKPTGRVKLQPVTRGARNASWSQATPSGTIEMQITNPDAVQVYVEALKSGEREFLVEFTPCPAPKAGDGHPFVPAPEGHYLAQGDKCADCEVARDYQLPGGGSAHPNG